MTLRTRLGSIRTRVVVGYVATVLVALFVAGLVGRITLLNRFDREIEEDLAAEIDQLELVIAEGDTETGEPFRDTATLFDTHLRRVLPGDDAAFYTLVEGDPYNLSFDAPTDLTSRTALVKTWAEATRSQFSTVDTEAGRARLLVVPVDTETDQGTFVAAAFTDNARSDIDRIFGILAIVALFTTAAAALVAAAVAGRIVRPIRDLTEVTGSIDDTDLSTRIPEEGDDELADLARTFNSMMTRLDAGFRSQREFLDDVAHELRTPITIIQGHLDLLGDDPDDRRETLAIVTDELARMNRYVDDLLLLAQAEQPDFLRRHDVDVDVLATSIMRRLDGLGERTWLLERSAHGVVHVDEQRIVQAVLNLAQNAVRHTGSGDEIGVGFDLDADGFRVSVRDTGPGVDPEIAELLLERHHRSARSRTEGGTGLGLSIVDAIVRAHGGSVSFGSIAGEGATFTIHVPDPATPTVGRSGDISEVHR